jgi:TM2 domain-containing membrane protein YozV
MNPLNDPRQLPDFSRHPDEAEDPFASLASNPYAQLPYPPYLPIPRKKKWLAGLLSFLVPGTGQFYLGLMQRGLLIMVLIILDIFTIVYFATDKNGVSIPLVTLFSLLMPVIYFYNIFDALQSTDFINARYVQGDLVPGEHSLSFKDPLQKLIRGNNLGVLLITAGALFLLVSTKPRWFASIFDLLGSYVGSFVLIAAGTAMFLLESRKK